MKLIPLSKGFSAIVDDADYEWLNQWTWHCVHGYAIRKEWADGKQRRIAMHYQIMPAPPGKEVDHRDRNRLNNQRLNLRIATRQQNSFNRGPNPGSSSQYKGVSWSKASQKWLTTIDIDHRSRSVGLFMDEIAAAKAYDYKAFQLFGEYAYLNFPDEDPIAECTYCQEHHPPFDPVVVLNPHAAPSLKALAVRCAQVKYLKQRGFNEAARSIAAQMFPHPDDPVIEVA